MRHYSCATFARAVLLVVLVAAVGATAAQASTNYSVPVPAPGGVQMGNSVYYDSGNVVYTLTPRRPRSAARADGFACSETATSTATAGASRVRAGRTSATTAPATRSPRGGTTAPTPLCWARTPSRADRASSSTCRPRHAPRAWAASTTRPRPSTPGATKPTAVTDQRLAAADVAAAVHRRLAVERSSGATRCQERTGASQPRCDRSEAPLSARGRGRVAG